jgi:hypothetical protein
MHRFKNDKVRRKEERVNVFNNYSICSLYSSVGEEGKLFTFSTKAQEFNSRQADDNQQSAISSYLEGQWS